MNTREHIHTVNDERGLRRVFCDGEFLPNCFEADERLGIAWCWVTPHQIIGGELASFRVHGVITVEFAE